MAKGEAEERDPSKSPLKPHKEGVTLALRLQPQARANKIGALEEQADGQVHLKAMVTAAPEKGRANTALIKLLSKSFGLPKSSFSFLAGESDRRKVLLVKGDSKALITTLKDQLQRLEGG